MCKLIHIKANRPLVKVDWIREFWPIKVGGFPLYLAFMTSSMQEYIMIKVKPHECLEWLIVSDRLWGLIYHTRAQSATIMWGITNKLDLIQFVVPHSFVFTIVYSIILFRLKSTIFKRWLFLTVKNSCILNISLLYFKPHKASQAFLHSYSLSHMTYFVSNAIFFSTPS